MSSVIGGFWGGGVGGEGVGCRTLLLRSVMPASLTGRPASRVMLRFILDMTEVPPSWLACAAECILEVLRLKLLLPGGGLTPPLGLLLGPPCADLNDELACEVTCVLG